jgi:hypothetical protein
VHAWQQSNSTPVSVKSGILLTLLFVAPPMITGDLDNLNLLTTPRAKEYFASISFAPFFIWKGDFPVLKTKVFIFNPRGKTITAWFRDTGFYEFILGFNLYSGHSPLASQ